MDAQLVGAPGKRAELDPRDRLPEPFSPAEHAPARLRRLALGSTFIHQPRLSSSRPSGLSISPSSAAGPPATMAQ